MVNDSVYLTINLLSLTILCVVLFYSHHALRRIYGNIILEILTFCMCIALFFDTLYYVDINMGLGPQYVIHNTIAMMIYFFAMCVASYEWVVYTYLHLYDEEIRFSSAKGFAIALPQLIIMLMVLLSPLTHWIFYIDNFGEYHRGFCYLIQPLLSLGYISFCTILILRQSWIDAIPQRRQKYRFLTLYSMLPIVGGIFQALVYGVNGLIVGALIAIILLYFENITQEITLDPLTKLNNRGQFDFYMSALAEKKEEELSRWVLLFFDMNKFKSINDTYGHIEGDIALICAARALRVGFKGADCFIARYGGDEFAVAVPEDDIGVHRSIHMVSTELLRLSEDKPYTLTVSVGIARYPVGDSTPINTWLKTADEQMYIDKSKKRRMEEAKKNTIP